MHEKVERQGLYYRLEQRMSVSRTIVAIAQHEYGELGPRLHEYKYLVHAVKGRNTGAIKGRDRVRRLGRPICPKYNTAND